VHPDPSTPDELDRLECVIDEWAAAQRVDNPAVDAVVRDEESGERRWFVRLLGEEKSVFSVWFHLRQRTLHVETYFMPAPEERAGELYGHLLRRNQRLYGFTFAIGEEDAIFLIAQVPNAMVDESELDRLLGSAYAYVEQCFRPAMRIGFGSRFKG
jgi:Putative bacterial sensory transduction regulator